jgi:hypothetical protein
MKGTHGQNARPNSYKDTVRVISLLRGGGRVAIWITIGLLLVRGLGAVLSPPRSGDDRETHTTGAQDFAGASLAVRFARSYLEGSLRGSRIPLLRGVPAPTPGQSVAQAEVSATESLGGGGEVLTVACQLRDARTLYLAVPIFRSGAGEVAVQGAPWVVAAPDAAGGAPERPRPLAGEEAGAIARLARKFISAYLAGRSAHDLAYLLAPGAEVRPLAGSLEALGGLGVAQLGDSEGRQRTVVISGRFRDRASGGVYPLAYRLAIIGGARWYVRAIEGAHS